MKKLKAFIKKHDLPLYVAVIALGAVVALIIIYAVRA
jgi:hypothetical protein